MFRYEAENQTETALGEAVLALLREKAQITPKTLLEKLQGLLVTESDADNRAAIYRAISEVKLFSSGSAFSGSRGWHDVREMPDTLPAGRIIKH